MGGTERNLYSALTSVSNSTNDGVGGDRGGSDEAGCSTIVLKRAHVYLQGKVSDGTEGGTYTRIVGTFGEGIEGQQSKGRTEIRKEGRGERAGGTEERRIVLETEGERIDDKVVRRIEKILKG